MNITFIGLGHMGFPMAQNLVKVGHSVVAFDVFEGARAKAKDAGFTIAATLKEVVASAEAIVTMLPSGVESRAVYLGDGGVLTHAPKTAILIDSSTIDVPTARDINAAASTAGFAMVDAPVSGGVGAATAGTLTFMVGGANDAFKRVEPILRNMGKAAIHAGTSGAGAAAKICNNMMLGIQMISVCEGFTLAEKLGLAPEKLFEISNISSGQCWSLTNYCPVPGPVPTSPANRDYQPGFTASMMLKDLKLAQDAAAKAGAATPLGAQAEALYALMAAHNAGNLDFSGIIRFLQGKLSG